ncbi:DUF4198 domain-containing protein [Hassallia byssoidea VB512170]|uniref:DUF4198 domain-containing protein n=1 Tax=Hassallia byssoidea VB512170 TaxID=1304833 RepID=A0A846H6H9_9CYAN|nr:DUF4198 domain-containing protein [Hassalia byssoidea]NEU73257.1 DUF4198 domain-containing protein [Hassalia byssoidea VB512170]
MIVKRLKELLLAVALLPIIVQPALAHVVWFEPENDGYKLVFGHPESGPDPTIDVSRFRLATGYDINKLTVPLTISIQDKIKVVPQSDIAALTAYFDNNGFRLRNPDNTTSRITQAEAEAINYLNVTNSVKYTKALYDWSSAISQPFGLPLEIQPLKNPFEVAVGEILPIQVLYQGNLITDALVEYQGTELALNASGIGYDVLIGDSGLQPIEASFNSTAETNLIVNYATTLTAQRRTERVPEPSAVLGLSLLVTLGLASGQSKKFKDRRLEAIAISKKSLNL